MTKRSDKPQIGLDIHEYYESDVDIIDDVDFGDLMMRLGDHSYSSMFEVTFRRTQEIELVLSVLGLVGIVGGSFFKTLGAELAKWLVEELKRRKELRRAEVKVGRRTANVGRRGKDKATKDIVEILRKAEEKNQTVEIRMIRKNRRKWT